MRVPSRPMLAVLSLVALPGLMHAQASELAGAGQSAAGQLREVPIASAAPTQSTAVTAPLMAGDPVTTDQSVTSAADALPIIDQVPVPSPDEAAVPSPASETGLGPTLASATAGIHASVAREDRSTTAAAHKGGLSTDAILMIVGAAALLAGLLIGGGAGTAIAVAGAVIGLYGLYLYLQ